MSTDAPYDPIALSWVEPANDPASDFPLANLPWCRVDAGDGTPQPGIRIGDRILRLRGLIDSPWVQAVSPEDRAAFADLVNSNPLGSGRVDHLRRLRALARRFLSRGVSGGELVPGASDLLLPVTDVQLLLPCEIRNYTDFYASIHHASTVGSMFRPDHPLLPNYKHVPIGYHGRASSIVPSGTGVQRPCGQLPPPDDKPDAGPSFGPCRLLDYELEVGVVIGSGNALGEPIPIARAAAHVLGYCLVNDWSARDVQKWEYQPLGPFLAKNFATTVSPYLITPDAIEPFRCRAPARPPGDPSPLPYLLDESDQARGGIDLTLEVRLRSAEMRRRGLPPVRLSRSNAFREMYWTFAQMIAHHASNGCNLRPGDLLASGTVSGREPGTRGCLLESTWQGRGADAKPLPRAPVELPTGEKRLFLDDGDEITLAGWCEREGHPRIGLGECVGTILPARA